MRARISGGTRGGPPGPKGGGVGATEDVRSPEGGGGRGSEAAAEDCEPEKLSRVDAGLGWGCDAEKKTSTTASSAKTPSAATASRKFLGTALKWMKDKLT